MATGRTATTWYDVVDPTTSESGVGVGDIWVNTDQWNVFICIVDTVNALQWTYI